METVEVNRAELTMTIGEVSRRAGVRPSTLRYYESISLLPAPRRVSGQRRYEPEALQLLAVIDFAKQSGFTIAEIQTLFQGFAPSALPTPASAHWKTLARRKVAELDTVIERARAMQRLLERGLCCECLHLEECALIAAEGEQPACNGEDGCSKA